MAAEDQQSIHAQRSFTDRKARIARTAFALIQSGASGVDVSLDG